MSQLPPGVEPQALPEPVASQQLRRHNISGHERWFGFDAINPPHDKAHYAMVAARPRDLYTADQMRAIEAKAAQAGYLAGLEAAAKVCEQSANLRRAAGFPEEAAVHMDFAATFRSMKGKQ